jgi:iron(III) transport system permease protein
VKLLRAVGVLVLALPIFALVFAFVRSHPKDPWFPSLGRLGASATLALSAAGIATLIGVPAGLALASCGPRLRRVLTVLTLVPLMMPPALGAIVWIGLGLPVGRAATVAVWVASFWPIPALLMAAAARRIDADAFEAGRLHLRPIRFARVLFLPALGPALLVGAALVAFLAFTDFGAPGTFGTPCFAMDLYQQLDAGGLSSTFSAVGGVFLPSILAIGFAMDFFASPLPLAGTRLGLRLSPPARRACFCAWAAAGLAGAVVPAIVLVGSMTRPGDALLHHGEKIVLTLWTAGAAAGVACAVWAAARKSKDELLLAGAFNLALPGVIVGAGLLELAAGLRLTAPLRDSGALLTLAYFCRYAVVAFIASHLALRSLRTEPLEAARLAGLSRWRAWRVVTFPHLRPALTFAAAVIFLLSIGDLGIQSQLVPVGNSTVMLTLFNLIHWGYDDMVATLGGLHLLAIWAVLLPLTFGRGAA